VNRLLFVAGGKRKKIIARKVRHAISFAEQAKGLMFEQKRNFDYCLIFRLPFETRTGASVHMMFVFFPIDIIYLDAQKRINEIARLKPWRLNFTPRKPAKWLIELPAGKAKGLKAGWKLEWE